FAGNGDTPAHEVEFADRMCIGVDAQEATEFDRTPVPAPVQFQAIGIAVDLDGNVMLRAGMEDRLHVHLVAGSPEQETAGDMAEDGGEGVGDGSYDAGCLFLFIAPEAAVDAGYHKIEAGEDVVRV